MRKPFLAALTLCILAASAGFAQQDPAAAGGARFTSITTGRTVLYVGSDGAVKCRLPNAAEAAHFNRRYVDLKVINPPSGATAEAGGLTIQLRATAQLDGFPDAKNAFIRAANTWQSILTTTTSTPVTIIIDVDYGPTRFGEPWDAGVLGSANSQDLFGDGAYSAVRTNLIARASTPAEQTLFNTLPATNVPTDRGSTNDVFGASSLFRAIGLIDPVADPAGEQANFGDPPSIGFNSNFNFDFNPDNGVTAGRIDFVTTAVHEIGHVLGFGSNVGFHEITTSLPTSVTMLDLFRFRPGIASGNFQTSQRILSTGGTQVFFAGSSSGEISLSTGNPNGQNGDENQASHWKDDDLIGTYIGIMDPTLPSGVAQPITNADKAAFDAIGWKLGSSSTGAPAAPTNLTATLLNATTARIAWVDNSNNETEFRIESSTNGGAFVDIGGAAANSTGGDISPLAAASTYKFRVRARNASGDSAYSNEATVTTSGGGSSTCTPSSTVLCTDSKPGDRRFRTTITYQTSQGGGLSGNGQAVQLNSLGVTKGGLFSFFGADNPEVLIKVLDGCGVNQRYWVFLTAGTNVGFTATVTDTKNGTVKTFTNPDLTAAQPVQDTNAFATCP